MERPRINERIVVIIFGFVIFAIFVGAMVNASYQLRERDHTVAMNHSSWLSARDGVK